jgi:hypothetical protein
MAFKRISEYNANRLLELEFEDGAWISLHDDDPGESGANEIADVDRVFVSAAGWSVAADKELHNVDQIDFENMPACEVSYFGAWDAETAGNFLRSTPRLDGSPLEVTPLSVSEGNTVTIPEEACIFAFSNVEV